MWRYGLFDYPTDGSEGDLETWCARLAEDGWQLWDAGIGAVIIQEGREVRRLSLRRETSTPMSTPMSTPDARSRPDRHRSEHDRLPG